jgi:1-acyl-sn-glycerol-3-phosphate acyltransferase
MVRAVPAPIRGVLVLTLITANTVIWAVPVYAMIVLKLVVPARRWRQGCERVLIRCAEGWIGVNSAVLACALPTAWDVRGLDGLDRAGRYLINANHQSWADVLVLQRVFNRRVPFLKFFLKQELIWVPILGLAWWGMDFPFMKRYSSERLARQPELRGTDLETTRRMCARFRDQPVSIISFLEGTRFTPAKHAQQRPPYAHLLQPKAGGIAFVLAAMGDVIGSMLDVTIVYARERPTLWSFACGRMPRIIVSVERRDIPADLRGGDYLDDPAFRARTQQWVRDLWAEKDAYIDRLSTERLTSAA